MTPCMRPRRRAAIEWFAPGSPSPNRTRCSATRNEKPGPVRSARPALRPGRSALDAAEARVYKERAGFSKSRSSDPAAAAQHAHLIRSSLFSPLEVPAFRAKALLQFFRKCANEYRYGQVVQRFQGFRVHHPGRRRQGSVRPLLGDPGQRFQVPEGKPEGVLRRDRRPERRPGRQHQAPRLTRAQAEKKPGQPGFFHGASKRTGFELARREHPFLDRTGAVPLSCRSMDKRKAWREQEQQLVERWNAAASRLRDAQAALSSPSSENGDAAPHEEKVLKAKAARAELEAVRKQGARLKVEFSAGKRY